MPDSARIVPDTAEFASRISRRLQFIYKSNFSESMVNRILAMAAKRYPQRLHWNEQEIILITYGDSLVALDEYPLQTLYEFMNAYLNGVISCVHILPFFPSTSDDGFAVSDYYQVNPILGTWNNVDAIHRNFNLMGDLVINHVSSEHPWFIQFLNNELPGMEYFITARKTGDYSKVVRPRSTPLFTEFDTSAGKQPVWTTFSSDQVDLNFNNPEVLLEIIKLMIFYISKGIRLIRLDAIAYLWKSNGTTCLHLSETHEIVKLLRDIAEFVCPGAIILTETNVPNKENWSYFGHSDEAHMVYQFSLPPLLLHAFFSGNASVLTTWASQIPMVNSGQTFLNYTASHDGIGVRPLEGLLSEAEIARLIEGMVEFGGLVSMKSNSDGTLSPYEINITYFEAMKGTIKGIDHLNMERFLGSQAIMLALKGVPAIYIHSLLATPNDHEGVKVTERARSINRQKLDYHQTITQIEKDTVVRRVYEAVKKMISVRRSHSAFHPDSGQEILQKDDRIFGFVRSSMEGEQIVCLSNVSDERVEVSLSDYSIKNGYDLLSDSFSEADRIVLEACQTMWVLTRTSETN
jgi:sucrose phosphorylase